MRLIPRIITLATAALLTASHASAQSTSLRVLADWGSTYRPRGDRPALHNGTVAFLGDQAGPDPTREAVFRGSLDGTVPFTPIAFGRMTGGDLIPWRTDGSWFVGFGNPIVWNDRVIFDAIRSNNGTGTFGEGAVVSTSGSYSFFGPSIASPSPGPLGLAQPVSFRYNNGTIVQSIPVNSPLPGGGTTPGGPFRTTSVYEGSAYGGGMVVQTTRLNTPTDFRYGIYAWSPVTQQLSMVVNHLTNIPTVNQPFEVYSGVDTDGQTVSFFGFRGFLGQGAVGGIYTTPITGAGPVTPIATLGEMSPYGQPYYTFGTTAIDGDTLFFDATIGEFANTRYAVFAACRGRVIPVYVSGSTINGKRMLDGRVNHRAVEGRDMVMWARYELAGAPGGAGVMLLHVSLNCPPVCIADMDDGTGTGTPDGGVTIDDLLYYLGVYEAGTSRADVDNGTGTGTPDGGVTIDDLLYYLARFETGC
jgi:hypothetical protein